MIDIRQSSNYANYLTKEGWVVSTQDGFASGGERINYFIKKIPILGSVLKIQRPKKINFETIKNLEKKYRVFQTIIEPITKYQVSCIKYQGYKLSKNPYLPSKTIHLDLTKKIDEIYRNFSKNCKYSIKKGEGLKIVEYSTPKEIKKFRQSWKNSVNFGRFVPSYKSLINLKKSFPNNRCIFLASHNKFSNIIGGAIFTISSHDSTNHITYYWYGFTSNEGRTSLSQYSLLYYGILWGKKMGCKIFDFEGIYDERFPIKSWLGFSHFKKQFGGKEILYPGCYTKFCFPF